MNAGVAGKILPGLQQLECRGIVEKGVAFGMTGNAHRCNAMLLQQSGRRDVAARLERPSRSRDVAGNQQHALHVGFAAQPRQKIVQHLTRSDFARGDVRHRIVTGLPQRCRRLEIAAKIVAGQESDGDVASDGEILAQRLELEPVRGHLHRGGG